MIWPFKSRKIETRSSSAVGYTTQLLQARAAYISGTEGLAEMTATVQSCVSLWEQGFSLADVDGTDILSPLHLALIGRSLALRGEALFWIGPDGLVPASDWDISTKLSRPTAYRLGLPDVGGGTTRTALAAEVIHFRIGCEMGTPYVGSPPLRRAGLTAGLLQHVEAALSDIYRDAPIGSQVIPYPESPETDLNALARAFRGYRGKVQVRESVNVASVGGPAPVTDWKANDLTPNLEQAMTKESLDAARDGINMAFGVLPGLTNPATTGPMVREAQRHLAQWCLQPIANQMAFELSKKLDADISLNVMRPAQAYDAGGRARALVAMVNAMAQAKEAGVDLGPALNQMDWD